MNGIHLPDTYIDKEALKKYLEKTYNLKLVEIGDKNNKIKTMEDSKRDFNDWYRYGVSSEKEFFWLINDKFKEGDTRYAKKLFAKLSPQQKKSFTEINAFSDSARILGERMRDGGEIFNLLNKEYTFKQLFKDKALFKEGGENKKTNSQDNNTSATTTSGGANKAAAGDYGSTATKGYRANAETTGYEENAATTGYGANAITTGYRANAATTSDRANASTTGDHANAATMGYGSNVATKGVRANAATMGNRANAATMSNYAHAATMGEGSNAATTGAESIAAGIGIANKAKAAKGSWIVLAEWFLDKEYEWHIKEVKAAKVDGEKIKADTWYKLENGKFTETNEQNR